MFEERITRTFAQRTAASYARLARAIAAHLGEPWRPCDSGHDGVTLSHEALQEVFVLIPGGAYTMGATREDLEAVAHLIDGSDAPEFSDWVHGCITNALPPREVHVASFLCSLDRRRKDSGDRVLVGRVEAQRQAERAGVRLPSEAEYEWLLRDGGRCSFVLDAHEAARDEELESRYGLLGLERGCWMADDWHPTYEGAPRDSRAWGDGDRAGVVREGTSLDLMLVQEDILGQLACLRTRGSGRSGIRWCASL